MCLARMGVEWFENWGLRTCVLNTGLHDLRSSTMTSSCSLWSLTPTSCAHKHDLSLSRLSQVDANLTDVPDATRMRFGQSSASEGSRGEVMSEPAPLSRQYSLNSSEANQRVQIATLTYDSQSHPIVQGWSSHHVDAGHILGAIG